MSLVLILHIIHVTAVGLTSEIDFADRLKILWRKKFSHTLSLRIYFLSYFIFIFYNDTRRDTSRGPDIDCSSSSTASSRAATAGKVKPGSGRGARAHSLSRKAACASSVDNERGVTLLLYGSPLQSYTSLAIGMWSHYFWDPAVFTS